MRARLGGRDLLLGRTLTRDRLVGRFRQAVPRGASSIFPASRHKEFGRGFVKPFGAPAGTLECFIEVPFMLGEKRLYPDGLIRVTRGSNTWTALVEVKTGPNQLATEQLENYLDIARDNAYDAVITISNEIPAVAGQHPTKVDKRKLKKVALRHVAWSKVLAEAVMQKEFRGVADPDQGRAKNQVLFESGVSVLVRV